MTNPCDRMMEQILAFATNQLSANDSVELQKHINSCPGCKEYLNKLEQDDRLFSNFAKYSEGTIERIEQNIFAAIKDIKQEPKQKWGWIDMGTQIIQSRQWVGRLSAAAAILLITGLAVIYLSVLKTDSGIKVPLKSNEYIAKKAPAVLPDIKLELQQVLDFAKVGDRAGLLDILKNGSMPAKLLAAKILADLGEIAAIEPLTELSQQYADADNPFNDAIEQIKASQTVQGQNNVSTDVAVIKPADANLPLFLRGRITDAKTGQAIDDATIRIYGPAQMLARTDANGSYMFKGNIADGLYKVAIDSVGYIGSYAQAQTQALSLSANMPLLRDFTLERGCMLDMDIVDVNNIAIADAVVAVYEHLGNENLQIGGSNASDANGTILVGAMRPSDKPYDILITHDDYVPVIYTVDLNDVEVIEYAKIVLEKGMKVAGYVYYSDNKPAANINLSAQPQGYPTDRLINVVTVDANGYFELKNIQMGKYRLDALMNEGSTVVKIGDVNLPDVNDELLNIKLSQPSPESLNTISGKVIFDGESNNADHQQKMISVDAVSQTGKNYSTTIDAGKDEFKFSPLEPGVYNIMFRGMSIQTKVVENVTCPSNLEIRLNVAVNPVIAGWVKNAADGKAITKFKILKERIESFDDVGLSTEETWYEFENPEGYFKLDSIEQGIHTLEVAADGFYNGFSGKLSTKNSSDITIILTPVK